MGARLAAAGDSFRRRCRVERVAVSAPEEPHEIEPTPLAGAAELGTLRQLAVRGSVWSSLGRVIPQLYTITTSIVAARFLGASGVGRLSYIAFVEATLIVACTLGLPLSLIRHVSEALGRGRRGELPSLMRLGWQIETGGAVLGFAILAGAGLAGAKPQWAWVFAGVACAGAVLHNVPSALLVGTQRWRQATIVGLLTGSAAMAAKVAALSLGKGIVALFVVDAVVAIVNLGGTSLFARRALADLGGGSEPGRELRRRAVRFAAVQSLGVIVTFLVWQRSELFFLDRYSSDVQIALYTISFSAVSALLLVPAAISATMTPAIATLFGAGAMERVRSVYSRSLRLIVTFTLPLTASSMAIGPSLVLLVYGRQFDGIQPVLLILLASFPVIPLLYASLALVIGLGRQRVQVLVGVAAAAVNILLDVLLIPRWGAVGAATANSAAQVVGSLPVVVYSVRLVGRVDWAPGALARTAVASAAGAGAALGAVWALAPLPGLLAALAAFGVAFALVALGLRVLTPDDARWLESALGGRLGGRLATAFRVASLPVQP